MTTTANTPSVRAEDWAHCAECDSYGLRVDMHKIIEWPTGKKLIALVCDACYWAETEQRMTTTAPNLAGMREYTAWYIKHPWHVSGTPESGDVPPTCDCGCQKERTS